MDNETLSAYNRDPDHYCQSWLEQPTPEEIYSSVRAHFQIGGDTADVGCGSGRDVDWLNRHGYPCVGFDASDGLLAAAAQLFPAYEFRYSLLPALDNIPNESFVNILCETVLMHLPTEEQAAAFGNLLRILKPGGILRASWRAAAGMPGGRDKNGRLYATVDADSLLVTAPAKLLEKGVSRSVSGAEICYVILRKEK